MDAVFEPLATALGASLDQVKVISCLLLSYPLSSIYVNIHNPSAKHVFSIAVSLFYLLPVFHLWSGTAQLLADVLLTYFITANVTGRKMPWIVFTLIMGHLTINHLIRAFFNISLATFEVTGPQMVLTMKLTTFAWNVYDGRQQTETLDKWQLEKRVLKMPSLLAFFGYAFYFPGFLVGPYLEYANYRALVDGSVFLSPKGKEKESSPIKMPAGRRRAAYWKMTQGLVSLALFVLYAPQLNITMIMTDWWLTLPWWNRIGYLQLFGFFERTKYYAIWSLTEGAAIVSGLGFTGYSASGASKWDGAANVNIAVIECPSNFKVLLDAWNMKTNVWLRECVYKRVTPKGQKPGFLSTMLTFATSAFWHGIAGGYYMTFVLGGFIQTAQRKFRVLVRPLLLPVPSPSVGQPTTTAIKRAYDVLGVLSSLMLLNYVVIPFVLLDVKASIEGWTRLYWYGHLMVFSSLLFFWGGGGRWLQEAQKKRVPSLRSSLPSQKVGQQMANGAPLTPGPHVIAPVDVVARSVEKKLE